MRSYRHRFHAGNAADVFKHWVLMLLLEHMVQKNKPLRYIDTHAGAGRYQLRTDATAEWRGGIGCLWAAPSLPPSLERLRNHVAQFNPAGRLEIYPGSPLWAQRLCRSQDEIRLFEWHPTDFRTLSADLALARDERVRCFEADGLAGLKALLPPPSRRALVIIDPPYERQDEYARVVKGLEMALARFAGGVYTLWYPELASVSARRLPDRLERLKVRWLRAHLHFSRARPDGLGMTGSGMFIVNPPWTLAAELEATLPALAAVLAGAERPPRCSIHRGGAGLAGRAPT
ncbi:MAG TPA: 23S rRNA (adenine(2030)-N(6))-methyltransferase RlmJ [Candidatus Acidoferrales bacterium]|nr:23S rRNA (adenine(2030)-N(6))-methyltransferase RlmJ [Candidatus Acidoferrales bacterium]